MSFLTHLCLCGRFTLLFDGVEYSNGLFNVALLPDGRADQQAPVWSPQGYHGVQWWWTGGGSQTVRRGSGHDDSHPRGLGETDRRLHLPGNTSASVYPSQSVRILYSVQSVSRLLCRWTDVQALLARGNQADPFSLLPGPPASLITLTPFLLLLSHHLSTSAPFLSLWWAQTPFSCLYFVLDLPELEN